MNSKIQSNYRNIRLIIVLISVLAFSSCSTSNRFIVTGLGYGPPEVTESLIYALPQTSLKVKVHFQKEVFIPGPYADYALKFLGIADVQKERRVEYLITSVQVEEIVETDADHIYVVNGLEGNLDKSMLEWALENDLIIQGDFRAKTSLELPFSVENDPQFIYTDVTMKPNTEMKKNTIYKTILTDTSYLQVPVTSEQLERKTKEKKAEEAAKLILEIRSDRYYVNAGLLDPYPDNFRISDAVSGLNKLERDYLSLFIGKSYAEEFSKEYIVTPAGSTEEEIFVLDGFSPEKGIGEQNSSLKLHLRPIGNAKSFRNLLSQQPESESYNRLYYRIPETCEVSIRLIDEILFFNRMGVYQSGSLVNIKVAE